MTPQRRAELALIGMAFIWGSSFVVMKHALAHASPAALLARRFTLAALLLAAFLWLTRIRWSAAGWRRILLTGLFLGGGYILQTSGLNLTTAGKSGFLTGLYIVMLPLLHSIVYQSAPQPREWVGVTMSAIGMAVMNWDGTGWAWGWGESLTVACAVMFAGHLLMLDHAVKQMDARLAGLGQIVVAAGLFWLAAPIVETPRVEWSLPLAGAIGFTAVLATALPLTLMAWAQQHTTPVRTGLLLSLEMPFAALAGWWWLGEPFEGPMWLGALLILGGILAVEWKVESSVETGGRPGTS